jgi:hypothetical protein
MFPLQWAGYQEGIPESPEEVAGIVVWSHNEWIAMHASSLKVFDDIVPCEDEEEVRCGKKGMKDYILKPGDDTAAAKHLAECAIANQWLAKDYGVCFESSKKRKAKN